jgi:hypothetical protein
MHKNIKYLTFLLTIYFIWVQSVIGQPLLKPGFDSKEFKNALLVNAAQMDSSFRIKSKIPFPEAKLLYRSEIMGLENRWDLWKDNRGVGIISLRGTTPKMNSWLENFYSAMVPATGEIKLNNKVFNYKLSTDTDAYVHVGWVLGLASMADDIVAKINLYHSKGINDFIIIGHSQGGALALLLRSYLYYLNKPLDNNIHFKTYASAAPKVGNINFSYNFDYITRGGWAYRIINPLDWVPQMPFSIQRLTDVSQPNPFAELNNKKMKSIPFFGRLYLKHVYKKLDRKTTKAQEYYTEILGEKAESFVLKATPDYKKQEFVSSFNYADCGIPIILYPTDSYNNNYLKSREGSKDGVFVHHRFIAYLYLLQQNYPERD